MTGKSNMPHATRHTPDRGLYDTAVKSYELMMGMFTAAQHKHQLLSPAAAVLLRTRKYGRVYVQRSYASLYFFHLWVPSTHVFFVPSMSEMIKI